MRDDLYRAIDRARPWGHLDEPPLEAREYAVQTDDGLDLRLRHVPPARPSQAPPALLVHGLGANHRAFHFPGRSLARWLSERGHDVWMPELRGHGASRPDDWSWQLDDYLRRDIPAVVDFVRRKTGASRLNWVGHSMGGVLLLCYGILEEQAPIARGITVGSALDYRVGTTGFRALLAARPLLSKFTAIPYGTLIHLLAPAMGRGAAMLEAFNVWPPNIESEIVRRIHAQCFHSIPVSLLESLATTFERQGLRLEDGFRFLNHARRLDFPVRLVAGSRDVQVDVEAVERTAEMIGENAHLAGYGEPWGHPTDYGHFDLLLGRRAPEEVWPEMAEFLAGTAD